MDRVKSCAAPNTVRIFLLVGNRLLHDTLVRLSRLIKYSGCQPSIKRTLEKSPRHLLLFGSK